MKLYLYPFVWLFVPFAIGVNFYDLSFIADSLIVGIALVLLFSLLGLNYIKIKNSPFVFPWIVFCLFFFLGSFITRIYLQSDTLFKLPYGKEIKMVGVVDDKSVTSSGNIKYEVRIYKALLNSKLINCNESVLLIHKNHQLHNIEVGSTIVFFSALNKFKFYNNPGEFNAKRYYLYKKVSGICFVDLLNLRLLPRKNGFELNYFFSKLRDKLSNSLSTVLSGEELNLAQALILGDREGLSIETNDAFANTGAMHILAVSGLHVGILMQILIRILSFFSSWLNKNRATIFALIIIWIYAFVTGFSPSIVRSVIMFSLLSIASIHGKSYSDFNILAFSALVILIWKPVFLFDVGFQLTYTAMLGIFWFFPFLKKQFYSRYKLIQLLYEGTVIGIAAQITTVPLTLYYFHQFPNYFILTNLALMAFSFVVLLLALVLSVLFWLVPIKLLVGFVLQKVLALMLLIVHFINDLPGAVADGYSLEVHEVFFLFLLIIVFFITLHVKRIWMLYTCFLFALSLFLMFSYTRYNNLNKPFICFMGGEKPLIVIRSQCKNTIYAYETLVDKRTTINLIKSFTKIYPGEVELRPLEYNIEYFFDHYDRTVSFRMIKYNEIQIGYDFINNEKIIYPLFNPIIREFLKT